MQKNIRTAFEKNKALILLVKFAVLMLILFVIDMAIGKTVGYFYFRQTNGIQYRTTYSIEKTTADVLVFGSSRASHHYNPEILERALSASCYNAGRDGNLILYHYAVLSAVLKRYSPKIIVLDIMNEEFKLLQSNYDKLSCLLPYYRTHPEMRSTILLKSKYEPVKLVSSIYPYNSSLLTIIMGNMEINKRRQGGNDILGYVPLTQKYHGTLEQEIRPTAVYEMDSNLVKAYDSFLKECTAHNINLYVVRSPFYNRSGYADPSVELAKQVAGKYKIRFLDYYNDQRFINDPSLFADPSHLNDAGAGVFSNLLADEIKKNRIHPVVKKND